MLIRSDGELGVKTLAFGGGFAQALALHAQAGKAVRRRDCLRFPVLIALNAGAAAIASHLIVSSLSAAGVRRGRRGSLTTPAAPDSMVSKKIWNPMPGTAFIWVSRCAAPLRRIAQGESGPTQPLTIALAGFKPALRGGLIFSSTQGPA